MFPGKHQVTDLADRQQHLIRVHRFWWAVGIVLLTCTILAQRSFLHSWYHDQLVQNESRLQALTSKKHSLEKAIAVFPSTLPEQNQLKHQKLSILLRLLQTHMDRGMRLALLEWNSALRIEGFSQRRENISSLQADLMQYGYFSAITLEQIKREEDVYAFSLLITFSEQLTLVLLRKGF